MAFMLEPLVVQLYWGYWDMATTCSTPSLSISSKAVSVSGLRQNCHFHDLDTCYTYLAYLKPT